MISLRPNSARDGSAIQYCSVLTIDMKSPFYLGCRGRGGRGQGAGGRERLKALSQPGRLRYFKPHAIPSGKATNPIQIFVSFFVWFVVKKSFLDTDYVNFSRNQGHFGANPARRLRRPCVQPARRLFADFSPCSHAYRKPAAQKSPAPVVSTAWGKPEHARASPFSKKSPVFPALTTDKRQHLERAPANPPANPDCRKSSFPLH